jgi:insulysin
MTSQQIIKPQNDKCNYYTFQLSNKLNVFLVEDPNTDYACATMLVKIGHSYDTVLGIAHFLEHMLFNGTEKYPDEKEYTDYINKNGGYSNAFTSHDHTCYYYTIQPECLSKSLDMFGSFFISPLLKADSVNREKEAVNSEHDKNIFSDSWRLYDIGKKAIISTNPLKNFGTGSNKTLALPNIHVKVREFFETYYSSDLMTLFIVAKENVEEVKNDITKIFSDIKLNITPENRQVFGTKIYDYPKTLKVVPVKSIEKLILSWDVPSFNNAPLRCPHNFLSHLMGHEGKNTIHYFLTRFGYITSLSSGIGVKCVDRCTFELTIVLTPTGAYHKNEIIFTVMKYIELIKSRINTQHMEDLYNEVLTLNAFQFKFSTKNDPETRTLGFAELCSHYNFDLHDILMLPYANENFTPYVKSNLEIILNEMTIKKSVTTIVSDSFENKTNFEDEYYGTKYDIVAEYPDLASVSLDVSLLDLPVINQFVSIKDSITNKCDVKPHLIQSSKVKLYCLQTNQFNTPDVSVMVSIDLPLSSYDKFSYTKTMLYFSTVMAEINHDIYMCQMANYEVSVYYNIGQLYISVYGNYGQISNVCSFLISSLLNKDIITEKIFGTAKYALKMQNTNCVFNSPYTRTDSFFKKQMCHTYYDNKDILSVINDELCNIDQVKNVIESIIHTSSCTMFVSGNCTDQLAIELGNIFEQFVPKRVYSPDMLLCDLYGEPSTCDDKLITNVENSVETNSAMAYYVFITKLKYGMSENWNKYICLLNVLDKIISTEYFDTLRTKEEFGYIANSTVNSFGNQKYLSRYYSFVVQSPHKSAEETIERTKKFLIEAKEKIKNLPEDEFEDIIGAMVSSLKSPFNNLNEMASFIFKSEIETEYRSFDLKEVLIESYESIDKNDLLKFYDDKFLNNRRSLAIGLKGNRTI